MEEQRIRIRLKSYDYRALDQSARDIVETSKRTVGRRRSTRSTALASGLSEQPEQNAQGPSACGESRDPASDRPRPPFQ